MNGSPRASKPGDTPALRALWAACFGDPEAFIDAYLTRLYRPGMAAVAESEGIAAAMAFFIPDFTLRLPGEVSRSVAYLYAICTHPGHRAQGLGAAVTHTAAALSGCELVCLLPADAGLRRWYTRDLGASTVSFVRERRFKRGDAPCGAELPKLSPTEYLARREALLQGIPHVEPPLNFLSLTEFLLQEDGGGFFALSRGVCAVSRAGGLFVSELLSEGSLSDAAGELLASFPEDELTLRTFSSAGKPEKDFVMALPAPSGTPFPNAFYWGLALDV
jgi:GNAT superfamily N-acetyltransferase